MKIGVGTTIMRRGLAKSGIDGIGQYTINLIKELSNLNIDIVDTNFYEMGNNNLYPEKNVININKYHLLASKFHIEMPIIKSYQNTVNLFHAMDYYIPTFRNIPVISTVMDTIPLSHPEYITKSLSNKFKIPLWKLAIEKTDHTITISNFSKLEILKYTNISEKNISVIPLGINPIFKKYSKKNLPLHNLNYHGLPTKFFLSVGTIQPRKNFENLVAAHLLLPDLYREAFPLILVGRYGWGCKKLYDDLRLRKNKHILWLNYVDERTLVTLIKNCYALVIPSLYEGFGLPLLEGFACQVPVISSKTSSLGEIGMNFFEGVDASKADELLYAMLNVIDKRESYNLKIKEAYQYSKKFSWKDTAEKTKKVYEKLL
jgi:glycosyltransferase involved in cell wall biosynthesis